MARTSIGSTTNEWSVISGEDSNGLDDVDLTEQLVDCIARIKLLESKICVSNIFQTIGEGREWHISVIFLTEKH